MAQPAQPAPSLFYDERGYFRSPEDAAAYAIITSSGQEFTTPAREARRMLAPEGDAWYHAMGWTWLQQHNLPELGDTEPEGWQNWFSGWVEQHPEAAILSAPPGTAPPQLHLVPPAPPRKVVVQVEPGSRLEALLAQADAAQDEVAAAQERANTAKAGVTTELTEKYPGTGAFDIPGAPGRRPRSLRYTAPNMLDNKRLKEERPDVYANYLVPRPRWTFSVPRNQGGQ